MDRRYRENQLSDGRGLPGVNAARRERLVGQYLAQARAVNRQVQSYGGSTGRPGGVYGAEALSQRQVVAMARGESAAERRRVFEVADGPRAELRAGYPGGRSVVAEARGYRKPAATA